ncbi:MAG: tripartite tricarboxylate transporter TctB family protein [Nocardioidaceae bacterium]
MTAQPETTSEPRARVGLPVGDLVLGTGTLLVFGLALLATFEWTFRTALFPRMVTIAGSALTAGFLVTCVVRGLRRVPSPDTTTSGVREDGEQLVDEDEEHDHEVEYVYATAGRAAWTQALAWVALFIVLLWVTGLFVASAVFSFCYLRWGASRSWLFAAVYAVVMSGVLYLALSVVLAVSVPEGLAG